MLMVTFLLTPRTQVKIGTNLAQVADALNLRDLTRSALEIMNNPII